MGVSKTRNSVLMAGAIGSMGAFGGSSACLAQSTPVSQERTLGVHTIAGSLCGGDEDEEVISAPDGFDTWNELLKLTSSDDCGAEITGIAAMESTMTPARIFAAGRVEHLHPTMPSLTTVEAECSHGLMYTFSIAKETPYEIVGSVAGGGMVGNLNHYIYVGGPSGRVFSFADYGGFTDAGVLPPGEYVVELTLWFDYENFIHRGETNGYLAYTFDMGLKGGPTCPCDWSGDGTLNSQDFFDFLASFFAGDADFNNSGQTDSQDFFDFLTCFFDAPKGCV